MTHISDWRTKSYRQFVNSRHKGKDNVKMNIIKLGYMWTNSYKSIYIYIYIFTSYTTILKLTN